MFNYFTKTTTTTVEKEEKETVKSFLLLVIVPKYDNIYTNIFQDIVLKNDQLVEVIEVTWNDFLVFCDPRKDGGADCYITITKGNKQFQTFKPDMLLVRSEVRGAIPEQDFRNSLFALMFSNIPSVNSLHSIYCFLERPVVQAELNRLSKTLGNDVFPVVEQSFFASHREFMYGNSFPAVVKMGHAHAGYGKMKIEDHHSMADFRSVVALTGQYVTAEPFLEGAYDLRIQFIRGSPVRVFKRVSMSGNWKTNTGSSHLTEIPIEDINPLYVTWAEYASEMFGGLDICTVDAIHDVKSDRAIIMEVNGTSSGFSPFEVEKDMFAIRNLVVGKMNSLVEETN